MYSTGGRPVRGAPVLNDSEQTTDAPDTQVAVYEFESFTATWNIDATRKIPRKNIRSGAISTEKMGLPHGLA